MPYNKKYPVEGDYFIKYTENQEDRISNAIGEVEESMTSIDNVFVGTPLTSNSNLNDVKEVGSHYVPTSAIKNTIINAPVDLPNAGFRIDIFNNGANANIQVLTSFSPSKPVTYTRAFNSDNWGEWKYGTVDLTLEKGTAHLSILPTSAITLSSASSIPLPNLESLIIDVSRDNANVFIQASVWASVDNQVGNLGFIVDGVSTGRLEAITSKSVVKLTPTTIVKLDKGTHEIKLSGYTQSTSAKLTVPAWNGLMLVAYEI